ncbi:MAG: hypothetical protein CM15mP115_24590 [Alphaproteobacteria bacterium]|nr:MAG: hypothetical protein CM15mP115_24590 [Alphaproteobacteria bacterium]
MRYFRHLRLSIGEARDWFAGLSDKLSGQESEIAARILKEINERLGFLVNVGLSYLSMARNSGTSPAASRSESALHRKSARA